MAVNSRRRDTLAYIRHTSFNSSDLNQNEYIFKAKQAKQVVNQQREVLLVFRNSQQSLANLMLQFHVKYMNGI
jgi:hypothetical protein